MLILYEHKRLDADGVTLIHELLLEERAKEQLFLIASHSSEDIAPYVKKPIICMKEKLKLNHEKSV